MHGLYLPIGHIRIRLCQSLKGFLVLLGSKEQIGIDPNDMDFGIALLQGLKGFFTVPSNVD